MSAGDNTPLPGQLAIDGTGVPDAPPRASAPLPVVATFVRDRVASFPEEVASPGERQKVAPSVTMMTLAAALTTTHSTDLHYVAYVSVNGLEMRLNTSLFDAELRAAALERRTLPVDVRAAALAGDYAVTMIAFVADVDDPVGHEQHIPARSEWRSAEAPKVAAMLQTHPGGFVYDTKGGYRIVYLLATPIRIASVADASMWSRRYKLLCASLSRRFGIVADPMCADWTRCYRAPRVVRDGKLELRSSVGNPIVIGLLAYEPTEADAAEAQRLAATKSTWRVHDGDQHRDARPLPSSRSGSWWDLDGEPICNAVALAATHFPATRRHELALALGGMLRRAGATEDDAREIVLQICEAGGSKNAKARAATVAHTYALDEEAAATGFTRVGEILGEDVARQLGDYFVDANNDAFLRNVEWARPRRTALGMRHLSTQARAVRDSEQAPPPKQSIRDFCRARMERLQAARPKRVK